MEEVEFLYLIFWDSFWGDVYSFIPERKKLEMRDGKESKEEETSENRCKKGSLKLMVDIPKRISKI